MPEPSRFDGAPRILLAGMLCLMILAFVPGFEQPGKTPREVVLLVGAPLLLASTLRSTRLRPNGLFLALVGAAALLGVIGAASAPGAERLAVFRDLALATSPWVVAICASLLPRARDGDDASDGWIEAAVLLALVPLGAIGLAQAWFGWTGIDQSHPPAGTFVNRNVAAQSLLALIPLAIPPLMTGRSPLLRWGAALAGGLGCAFLIATRSRGAWLGFAAGGVVAVVVWWLGRASAPRPRWAPVLLAAGLACAALVVPVTGPVRPLPSVKGTLSSPALAPEGSGETRLAIWRNTSALISDRPLLGVGAGRFDVVYPRFQSARIPTPGFGVERQPEHAHHDLLEFAATGGVATAAVVLVLLFGAIVRSARRGARCGSPLEQLRWTARTAALTGVLVHGLVSFPLHSPASAFLAWLLIGRCWTSADTNASTRSPRRRVAGLVLCLVPLAAWIGWREVRSQSFLSDAIRAIRSADCESAIVHASESTRQAPWKRREVGMAAMAHFRCDGDPQRSLVVLERALDMHPHQLNLLLAVGARRLKAQRPSGAATVFLHAVEIAPDLERGWLGLAMARFELGDREGAAGACNRALQIDERLTAARTFCIGNGLVRPAASGTEPAGSR